MITNIRTLVLLLALLCLAAPLQAQDYRTVTVADGLDFPWAVDFLPGGGYIVTEKPGRLLRIAPDGTKTAIRGLPAITARAQGGLLDVALSPGFKTDRLVYISYVARGQGGTATRVARGRLAGDALEDVEVIFRAAPNKRTDLHFGSRLLFAPDGTLLVTLGDRFFMDEAQDLSNHMGAIIRINPDGSVPADNPFIGTPGHDEKIVTYGNRNVQGIATQPGTDTVWFHEHGPQGGDEVNILKPGVNYGWPVISYGINYDGRPITDKTHHDGMEQPVIHWTPSIAPCGMAFYDGDKFPDWRGDLFVGALAGAHLRRLEIDGRTVTAQHELLTELESRIRDVAAGPDGYLYVLTDSHDGALLRLEPAK